MQKPQARVLVMAFFAEEIPLSMLFDCFRAGTLT
jgi:hypothetical protein